MKKQMLTLAVCLALTATSSFAASCTVTPKTCTKTCPKATTTLTPKCPDKMSKQNFEEKIAKEREDLYCKLNLTQEQRTNADALHQKNKTAAEPLFKKLHEEKVKLHELKAQKACAIKIDEQKLKVKEAKRALKKHMEASRKEFEAILNKDQLAKFEELKAQKKEEWKNKKCKCHHHEGFFDDDEFAPKACPPEAAKTEPKCPCKAK